LCFTLQEDALLLEGHRRHGNKWTMIAQEIGGRTDNAVKNRWAALEKKRRGDDDPSAAAAGGGGSNPGYGRYMPPVMRPQNDLLGVRRTIAKDQPRYRTPQQLQQLQMQQLGGMLAGEGPWAMQEARQTDQLPYAMPAVTTGMVAPPSGVCRLKGGLLARIVDVQMAAGVNTVTVDLQQFKLHTCGRGTAASTRY
jgi:hypothetical protein